MNDVVPRDVRKADGVITEADLSHQKQQLGSFGRLFGSKENAPTYLAGLVMLISVFGNIFGGAFAPEYSSKGDLVKVLGGIALAALTFIGGASSRS